MVVARSNLRVVTEVTRSLEFSPQMHSMADRVVTAIAARNSEYNAVHLRIEKDARDWSQIMGGPEVRTIPPPASRCLVVIKLRLQAPPHWSKFCTRKRQQDALDCGSLAHESIVC